MYKLIRKSEGLTLVEIIISLAILGIIIVPLSTLFVNSAMINRRAEIQLLANQTAQRFMEEFKTKSFAELLSIMSAGMYEDSVGDMDIEVDIETLGVLPGETEFALHIVVKDTVIEFIVDRALKSSLTILDGSKVRLNFSGTDYADSVEIRHNDFLHEIISDLHGDTNEKTHIKIIINSDIALNLEFANDSANSVGPLEVHKYTSEGITDNTTTSVVSGHVMIVNHEGEFTLADRYQSVGLVVTVRVKREGQQILEMAQARKLEW